jgi:hypothetical protein
VVIFSGTNPPETYRALGTAINQTIESDLSAAPRINAGSIANPVR